jgi:predicted ATPase/class 3 adenylate cyclase
MLEISGYSDLRALHHGRRSLIFRARRELDAAPVVIKTTVARFPSTDDLSRLRHEFAIGQAARAGPAERHVVRHHALEPVGSSLGIVLEDFGAVSLRSHVNGGRPSIERFLELSLGLVRAVGAVHKAGVAHFDINPDNILYNPETGALKLCDMSAALRLGEAVPRPGSVHPTPAYASPETTNRTEWNADARADLYSLGITLFQLLTGALPFAGNDSLETLHHHLAATPPSPQTLREDVPELLARVILRMIAKNPDERYRSAPGVLADLESCRTWLAIPDEARAFELGPSDHSVLFATQRGVYGRERELSELLQAFERVSEGGGACVTVRGDAGVGKSSLVGQLRATIVERGALFCTGKFEPLTSNAPYTGVSTALRGFTHSLLARPEAELVACQKRLLAAVGPNGQRLIELVPEIELLLGPQPPAPELDAEQAQASFRHVIRDSLVALATPENPLVVFLDDMQWADPASRTLAAELAADERFKHAMLIVAYRQEGAEDLHRRLKSAREGSGLLELELTALALDGAAAIVANATGQSVERLWPLSRLVWDKTGGNPFFVEEFLRMLHGEELLYFDAASRRWEWDLAACEAQGSTGNVIELMLRRIHRLAEPVQRTLRFASCLSSEFDAATLGRIASSELSRVEADLAEAVRAGLIRTVPGERGDAACSYRFHHDQVRQAAYALTPEPEREALHLGIGRILLEECGRDAPNPQVFAAVEHLRHGLARVTETGERLRIAELCLLAGRRAKSANAYLAACDYLRTGIGLLGPSGWDQSYELALATFLEHAESSYLGGEIADMEASTALVLEHGRTVLDRIQAQQIRLSAVIARNDPAGAIALTRAALAELGRVLPTNPSQLAVTLLVLTTAWRMRNETTDSLANRPRVEDPAVIAAMQLYAVVSTPAYLTSPRLFPIIICDMMELILEHGNSAWSSEALLGWAAIQIAGFNAITRGFAIGSAAPRVVETLGVAGRRGRTHVIFGLLVRHWVEPLRDTIEPMREAARHALEHGDLTYASAGAVTHTYNMLLSGRPLAEVHDTAESYERLTHRLGQDRFRDDLRRIHQLVKCLRGQTEDPRRLTGELFDDQVALERCAETGDRAGLASLHYERGLLLFINGDPVAAAESCERAVQYLDSVLATVYPPLLEFLSSLLRLQRLFQDRTGASSALRKVRKSLKRLELWSRIAPSNHAHRVHLVRAELERFRGNTALAAADYERAIEVAERNGYLHEQAMALEAAARFYSASGQMRIAAITASAAKNAWAAWGAPLRVRVLEVEFAPLLVDYRTLSAQVAASGSLDLESVQKAARAIVAELRLPQLVERLLGLAMENSGAQRGLVLLSQQGQLRIAAGTDIDAANVNERPSAPSDASEESLGYSTAITGYVARTLKPLVVSDAGKAQMFEHDEYVRRAEPRSVICLPLVSQGKLAGMVYLENNRLPGAFQKERIEVLRVLSALAAIALENARLYEDIAQAHAQQLLVSEAQARFVPAEFLRSLKRASIVEVGLGDSIRQEMSILFSDVRGFTRLVESMPASEHVSFINGYLGHMEPAIVQHGGFVDSYLGDGILALFEGDPDNALYAAIAMSRELGRFNEGRGREGKEPIEMGVGVSTGSLTLGTIGGPSRIKCGVVGDPVNLAARIESLTRRFGSFLLISHETRDRLKNPEAFELRRIDRVRVKGKRNPIDLYEVLDAEPALRRDAKRQTRARFDEALSAYIDGRFDEAERLFRACVVSAPEDGAAEQLAVRSREYRLKPPVGWDGVDGFTEK